MSDETKDPRETVAWIVEHYHTQGGGPYIELWRAGRRGSAESQVKSIRETSPGETVTMRPLGYLDAADPIRQLWPEVVEALEGVIAEADRETVRFRRARSVLARARAITPTEEDDNGE